MSERRPARDARALAVWMAGGIWPPRGWLADARAVLAPGWQGVRSAGLTADAAEVWARHTVASWVASGVYGDADRVPQDHDDATTDEGGPAEPDAGEEDEGASGAPGAQDAGATSTASTGESASGNASGGERPSETRGARADGAGEAAGVWSPAGVDGVLAWADALGRHPDVLALIERLGRRLGERGPPPEGGREVVGVGLGRSVAGAAPSSLAMLGDPDFDVVFWRQLAEGRLMSWSRGGDGAGGEVGRGPRGPALLALDTSASMAGPRGLVGRATALAVARALRAQGRAVRLVTFGAEGEQVDQPLTDDPSSWVRLLAWGFSGGTDLDGPVVRALAEHAVQEAGDLVLVTDGEASLDPRTVAAAEAAHRDRRWSLELVLVGDAHLAIRSVLAADVSAC